MRIEYEGIEFICEDDIPEEEAQAYIRHYRDRIPGLSRLEVEIDGEYANVSWQTRRYPPFERIRRITGYLVGTLDRFNDAKRAEESQRVKHEVCEHSHVVDKTTNN